MSYLMSPRVVLGNTDVRLWQCRPMANKPQYSSSKQGYQVVYCMAPRPNLINLNLPAFATKNTQLMTVYMETVAMAKYRPRQRSKNQSDCLDLHLDFLLLQ